MARLQGRRSKIPPFRRIKAVVNRVVKQVAKEELKKFAWELRGFLTHGILAQRFQDIQTIPLSASWKARKREHGLDSRVLVSTKQYVNHIRVVTHSPLKYEINVPESTYALDVERQPTDVTLRQLGAILEFGSAAHGIPARRHWRVTLEKAQKRAPAVAKRIMVKASRLINQELRG